MFRHGVIVIGVAALLLSALTSWASQDPISNVSPTQFVEDLARRGITAGVVVAAADLASGQSPSTQFAGDPRPIASLVSGAVTSFNSRGGHYRASVAASGYVHVRPVDEPPAVRAILDKGVYADRTGSLSVTDAIFTEVVKLMSGRAPQGIAGTGQEPGPECHLDQLIVLPTGSMPATEYLDKVVSQVPGLSWIVTFDPEQPNDGLNVGLLCGNGQSLTITVFP